MPKFFLPFALVACVLFTSCVRDLSGNTAPDLIAIEDSAMLSTAVITAVVDQQKLNLSTLILQVQTMKILVSQNPLDVVQVLQIYVNTEVDPQYRAVSSLALAVVVRRVSPILESDLPQLEKSSQVVLVATAVLNGVETALQLHQTNTQRGNV